MKASRILKRIFTPPWFLLVPLIIMSAILLYYGLVRYPDSLVSFVSYGFSSFTLISLIITFPSCFRKIKGLVLAIPFLKRYHDDNPYRNRMNAFLSLIVNFVYAAFRFVTALVFGSWWYGILATYHLCLSVIKMVLLHGRCKVASIAMLALTLPLSGIIIQVVRNGKGFSYPGYVIFAVATYTFVHVTMAIISFIRYKKSNAPSLFIHKAMGLSSALVSLFSLQTAMFSSFGGDKKFSSFMNHTTGIIVGIIILATALSVVVRVFTTDVSSVPSGHTCKKNRTQD